MCTVPSGLKQHVWVVQCSVSLENKNQPQPLGVGDTEVAPLPRSDWGRNENFSHLLSLGFILVFKVCDIISAYISSKDPNFCKSE